MPCPTSSFRVAPLARAVRVSMLVIALAAGTPQAFADSASRYHDIPAGSLGDALATFAAQVGINLPLQPGMVDNRQSAGLQGEWSTDEGFRQLLQGTGLQAIPQGGNTYTLQPLPSSSTELQLAPTSITGAQAMRSSAFGPVEGYAVRNSSTGTKTDTPLRDIPQSIQVVSRQVLEEQQVSSLGDALTNISGIQRGNTHGGTTESFFVRGFHATTYAVDGVMTNSQVIRPEALNDLANIEHIEVLKGPASVLYGRGNPGGLINLVTRKPTYEPQAQLKAQAGSWDFYRLQTYVSGALDPNNTLAGGLAMATQTDGGYRDTFHANKRNYFAPTLRWQPNDATTIDAGIEYIELEGPYDRGLLVVGDQIDRRSRLVLEEPFSRSETDKSALWIKTEHHANDWLTLRQVTRMDESRKDFQNVNFQGLQADGRTLNRRATDLSEDLESLTAQFEAVASFATYGLHHTTLLGYEYVTGRRDTRNYRATLAPIDIYNPVYGALPGPYIPNTVVKQEMDSHAVYLQDQIDLNEQWKLLAGVRWDSVDQTLTTTFGNGRTPTSYHLTPESVSPRLGVVYQPLDWLSLYASYSESFAPQSDVTRAGDPLDPETGEQYEIGAKFDLIPERLSATLALFEITRQNVAADDPADTNFSIQTGEQRVRGVELDVTGAISEGWNVIGNISVVDAKLTKDTQLPAGNRLEAVPIFSGSLWSTYQFQDGAWKDFGVGAGVIFAGKRYGDLENSFSGSGYVRFDASLFYDVSENVRVSLNGQNLTNTYYMENISSAGTFAGEPASVVATLNLGF